MDFTKLGCPELLFYESRGPFSSKKKSLEDAHEVAFLDIKKRTEASLKSLSGGSSNQQRGASLSRSSGDSLPRSSGDSQTVNPFSLPSQRRSSAPTNFNTAPHVNPEHHAAMMRQQAAMQQSMQSMMQNISPEQKAAMQQMMRNFSPAGDPHQNPAMFQQSMAQQQAAMQQMMQSQFQNPMMQQIYQNMVRNMSPEEQAGMKRQYEAMQKNFAQQMAAYSQMMNPGMATGGANLAPGPGLFPAAAAQPVAMEPPPAMQPQPLWRERLEKFTTDHEIPLRFNYRRVEERSGAATPLGAADSGAKGDDFHVQLIVAGLDLRTTTSADRSMADSIEELSEQGYELVSNLVERQERESLVRRAKVEGYAYVYVDISYC